MIAISPYFTQRTYSWSGWKALNATKGGQPQYDDDGVTTTIWFYDGPEVHICTIWNGSLPDGVLATYSQNQNDTDKSEFEAYYKSKANKPISIKSADGKLITSMWPSQGTRKTFITGNWADKTTWYQKAVRVVDEVAVCGNNGTYTEYGLTHTNLIDIYHGKITGEDFLKDAGGNSFRAKVKVNDVLKSEQDPHPASGGDYTINYETGVVTFLSGLTVSDVVKVTYHYQNGSEWVIKPDAGKILLIKSAEVQFSKDISITDTVRFQPYGFVDVFAPQLMPGVPSGTLIPLGAAVVYKTLMDYINEANGAYPEINAMGQGWRNMQSGVVTFPWNYQAMTELKSSYGMEVRIKLEHETPFIGSAATAAFYCLSESE